MPQLAQVWHATQRDSAHYWPLARRPPLAERADLPHPRGVFLLPPAEATNPEARRRPCQVYDTTLRDGAQREGISYSVVDKLAVARLLDEFGVGFIEGGWPGAMPKDTEFFRTGPHRAGPAARACSSRSARPARPASRVADDPQVRALLDARDPGRRPGRQVRPAARRAGAAHHRRRRTWRWSATPCATSSPRAGGSSSTASTSSTATGYDPAYTASVVQTALAAGAERVVMCDTNGGMLPSITRRSPRSTTSPSGSGYRARRARLGIHCQNDTVLRGGQHDRRRRGGRPALPVHRQRVRRAPRQRRPLRRRRQPPAQARAAGPTGRAASEQMVRVSHAIAEIANIAPDTHQAYVGAAAFAHKAGLHASAIKVDPLLYNHVDPSVVGNDMRILVTEMAGRASIELKSRELGLDLAGHPETLSRVTTAGQGAGGAAAGRSRPPTRRSSCWSAPSCRRARRPGRSPWSRTGCSSSTARTARWSPRRPSRSGSAASG